jgi:hypothetical protein
MMACQKLPRQQYSRCDLSNRARDPRLPLSEFSAANTICDDALRAAAICCCAGSREALLAIFSLRAVPLNRACMAAHPRQCMHAWGVEQRRTVCTVKNGRNRPQIQLQGQSALQGRSREQPYSAASMVCASSMHTQRCNGRDRLHRPPIGYRL